MDYLFNHASDFIHAGIFLLTSAGIIQALFEPIEETKKQFPLVRNNKPVHMHRGKKFNESN